MQAKRQAVIHRKLISNEDIFPPNDLQKASSMPKQSSKEPDNFKGSRISKMGRPKKHSLSIHSQKIGDGFLKFDLISDEDRKRLNAKTRNIFTFFPTYTQLIDSQISDFVFNKTIPLNDQFDENKHFSTIPHSQQTITYQRKKLAPIKKPKSQKGYQTKKTSNVSFLNVQKLSLQRMGDSTDRQKQKMISTASYMSRRGATISRNSYDIAKGLQVLDVPQLKMKATSFREEVTPMIRIKPFVAPFERFYYFDFLWKIAYSNAIKVEFLQYNPKKYKVYIGSGNNSMLIKTLFKRRDSWWSITTNIEEANFVWTQIKVGSIFNSQQKNEPASWLPQPSEYTQKKTPAYKRHSKIMNQHDTQNWMSYYHKNKQIQEKMTPNFQKRTKILRKKKEIALNTEKIKIHNHFPRNYVIGNKKALFSTMKKYYECSRKDVFQFLPLTFHIENGLEDQQYFKFLKYFYNKAKKTKQNDEKGNKIRNIWIVKPGQFTNRGNGITVCRSLEQVKNIVKNKKKLETGGMRTYIVQQYLDRPFLYQRRKFDIRHYMMISCVNGHIKGYWYESGYIRTTSYQYSVKNGFSSVHLTNDAVQKQLPDYGKYQKGNKISYDEFQKYLENQYNGKYSFFKTIYPQMKLIAKDSMRASAAMLDENRRGHNFEIFGFDFMIDSQFKPWLIQINTNPCLQLNCPILMDIIPNMLENAIKIGVDSLLPPPHTFSEKRPRFSTNILEQNKFQLLFDSTLQEEQLTELLKEDSVKLNFKQLEKDQEQLYEDDGVQLDD